MAVASFVVWCNSRSGITWWVVDFDESAQVQTKIVKLEIWFPDAVIYLVFTNDLLPGAVFIVLV